MPGGSGTAVGGFDGVVKAGGQTVEVPAGTSVWELSVETGAGRKANQDYDKRLEGPGEPTTDVTYVEVILAPWRDARKWATSRTSEGRWKEVRAYNLDQVHGWLDRAPASTVWLAEQLGLAMAGVHAADSWFKDVWMPSTTPALSGDYALAGRTEESVHLASLLASGQRAITVSGEIAPQEFYAFVAATVLETKVAEVGLAARTLFIDDKGSLSKLVGQTQPMVLVLADATLAAELPVRHTHQLILLAPPGSQADVSVARPDSETISNLLKADGETWERADNLGALARRSFSSLRRALANTPATLTPDWARDPDVIRRRLMLVGAWHGASEGDREIVEQCIERSYSHVQEAALTLAQIRDTPMLGRVDEQWHLLAAEDTWMLLGLWLTRDDLIALQSATFKVLAQIDPFLGLTLTEQLISQTRGTRQPYSKYLRRGLARSLAILGATETSASSALTAGSDIARQTVRDIFEKANAESTYKLWTSLSEDVLGLLAEAAPEEFLTAMQEGLRGQEPLHANMFTDSKEGASVFGVTATYVGFMGALERLAWSSDYFDESVDLMAKLAALDPGGHYANRPSTSLVNLFCCWRPNTVANEDQRRIALQRLLRIEPVVTRRLLLELVPKGHDSQFGHSAPEIRDWKREPQVTWAEIHRNANSVIQLLLDDLDDKPERFIDFIEKVDHVSPEHRKTFLERLREFSQNLVDDGIRTSLFEALQAKVAHHREYGDSAWAMSAEDLDGLEAACQEMAPRSALLRSVWLFKSPLVSLGESSRRDDFEEYDKAVAQRRTEAVDAVVREGGLDAVAELAESTKYPHLIGTALAMRSNELDTSMVAWLTKAGSGFSVANAYFVWRFRHAESDLVDELIQLAVDNAVRSSLILAIDDPLVAWAKLRELPADVAEGYWRRFHYFGLGHAFGGVVEAARGLLSVHRNAAVLDFINLYLNAANSLEVAELAALACEYILEAKSADPEFQGLSSHTFERIFGFLHQYRDQLGLHRLIKIEAGFLPALGFEAKVPTVHLALRTDPMFFAEMVSLLYPHEGSEAPPLNETPGTDDQDEANERRKRDFAFKVLTSWHGFRGGGTAESVDTDALREWVMAARQKLKELGRPTSGDHEIGQTLASVAPDSDGMSPPRAVRSLLEELQKDDIDNGLQFAISRKRGVTTRGMYDGGAQERQLAAQFHVAARESVEWPRTRRLLRRLAESYDREARLHEDEAERRRRGLER